MAIMSQLPPGLRRSSRRLSLAAVAVSFLLLVSSCGGSSSNNASGKSADQILRDAQTATDNASTMRVAGSVKDNGTVTTLDIVAGHGRGGGTVGQSGATFDVVVGTSKIFVKADNATWLMLSGGDSVASELLADRWISTSLSNRDFADVTALFDISKFTQLMNPVGQLSVGKVTTRNGVSVIPLNDSAGGTLYVAAKGPPYMIAVVGGGGESGELTFSEHGTAKVPSEPTEALDIDQLQSSESVVTNQVVHHEATAIHNTVSAALP